MINQKPGRTRPADIIERRVPGLVIDHDSLISANLAAMREQRESLEATARDDEDEVAMLLGEL